VVESVVELVDVAVAPVLLLLVVEVDTVEVETLGLGVEAESLVPHEVESVLGGGVMA
jgi:hypothetical protein